MVFFDVDQPQHTADQPQASYPKVILISLDGATPRLVNQYLASGVLSPDKGLGPWQVRALLRNKM